VAPRLAGGHSVQRTPNNSSERVRGFAPSHGTQVAAHASYAANAHIVLVLAYSVLARTSAYGE